MDQRTPEERAEIEAFRERVRRTPGVIVHRPEKQVPYVPDITLVGPITLDELLGYDDDDDDEESDNKNATDL
ncbi:MAG TPA: hypothetical protein VFL82_16555 [Thermomicrobiales bacterium]|jgi:hypothetical protein|nr:hypothetical protein [Thermomicrobiales bacterium]